MVPLAKYQAASAPIRALYASPSARAAYDLAAGACVDYLVIGPPERTAYPQLQPLLDAAPHLFYPAFRNGAVAIYALSPGPPASRCRA
jgi:hypothetical protein